MDRHVFLPQRLKQIDSLRKEGRWADAIKGYTAFERVLPNEAGIKHNIAVCYLALNDAENAIKYADRAIELNEGLWQSQLLKAKSLIQQDKKDLAISLLEKLVERFPVCSDLHLELASLALDELGNAGLARHLAQSICDQPRHLKNARLTELMANLYDSKKSADEISEDLCDFAEEHLVRAEVKPQVRSSITSRRRVGLISPQFSCSPVYFFCIGALRHLAHDVDLVVLNRGRREDWATKEFRSLAREWFDVAELDSEKLSTFIARQGLDVLIDMGGWMDPAALSAVSAKPAKRIYKWVGGQSATTGIRAFDGFFTDRYQSLQEHQPYYAEPLIFLESGYVSYTPPPYMPAAVNSDGGNVFGVIANPVKISQDFLAFLKHSCETYLGCGAETISLRFIDRRYQHTQLRSRITSALQLDSPQMQERMHLDFIVPRCHRTYLEEVGKLAAVLDTFPYTGGLTTMEALVLGVPCITKVGRLFNERHSYSHCKHAGMEPEAFEMKKNLPELLHFYHHQWTPDGHRNSLISKSSGRLDHQALAQAIDRYF